MMGRRGPGRQSGTPYNRRRARFWDALWPALLLAFTLFLFGPLTIYYGNPGELEVGYLFLLSTLAPIALLATVMLLIAGCLLPSRRFRFYNPVLLGLGVSLWLQGNVIVASYGSLDGTQIDFAVQNWRVWHETALWLGVPALLIILYPRYKQNTLFVAQVVLALEVFRLVLGGLAYPEVFKQARLEPLPPTLPVLSSQQNILHIVLDGFQSDCFPEVLERFPEWADAFEGFVFYENSMGHFPTTRMSIPAILTGEVYRNQLPMDEFLAKEMSTDTLPGVLYRSGYAVDVLTLARYRYGEEFSSWSAVPRPFAADRDRRRFAVAEVLDLTLFRHLPHLVKPWIYRNQNWLLQSWGPLNIGEDRKFEPSNAVAFMRFLENRLRVEGPRPRYKFMHFLMPHLPLVLDSDCNFLGPGPESRQGFIAQSACTVRVLSGFLDALRELGVYRDALIVVSSDHGNRFPSEQMSRSFEDPQLVSRAAALLLVKPPGSFGELAVSRAQVSLRDIPVTIADSAGIQHRFPGRSALSLQEVVQRPRRFYHYLWRQSYWNLEFLPELREYLVTGDVLDSQAWHDQGRVLPRLGAPEESFVRVDLGEEEHRKELGRGWGERGEHEGTSFVWGVGRAASLMLPRIPRPKILLTARLVAVPTDALQVITVFADGREIVQWKADATEAWRVYSAIIPNAAERHGPVKIEFHFAQTYGPDKLAAAFDYIEAKPASP